MRSIGQSWKDLLKPQYKGKIAVYDPRRSGPGQTPVGYLATLFGNDYLRELYVGQQVRLTADNRQLAEWVAHGEYPIGIGLVQFAVEIFRNPVSPSRRSTDPPEQSLNERQIERRDQWRPHRIAKLTRPIIAALAAELCIVAEKSARRNLKAASPKDLPTALWQDGRAEN
jgi:hypothetical protein